MKKLFIALPVIALSVFFTFCAKEDSTVPARSETTGQSSGVKAEDRGPLCTLTVTADNDITICGIGNNNQPCTSCAGAQLKGTSGPGVGPYTVDLNDNYPIPFCITAGPNPVTVRIFNTTFGLLTQFQLQPGQCRCFAAGCAQGIISEGF